MGAPAQGMEAADHPAAETLLDAFKTISAAERRHHASVLNYWLSIRGDKEFPALHDLDPLELTDAGPNSILLELISGGHDAEVRHLGEALRFEGKVDRIIDAPNPSILACVAKKLPIVAISRDFLALEDEYEGPDGKVRCWATLLPLSAGGAWVDYVYALVTFDSEGAKAAKPKSTDELAKKTKAKEAEADPEPNTIPVEEVAMEDLQEPEPDQTDQPVAAETAEPEAQEDTTGETEQHEEAVAEIAESVDQDAALADADPSIDALEEETQDASVQPEAKGKPGFSKLFDNLVGLTGFHGHGYKVEPSGVPESGDERAAEEFPTEESQAEELQSDESELEPANEAPVDQESVPEEATTEDSEPANGDHKVAESVDEPVDDAPAVEETADPAVEPSITQNIKHSASEAPEGPLKSKLADVRNKADEARQAKLRANAALYDGLSAAYDFALDAEDAPEEYLRLVEAEGLKIQLRSPMRPVVKLAFNGMCDEGTIRQLEAVLAWALDNELPRGSLAEQIEAAGGIGPILSGEAKAA